MAYAAANGMTVYATTVNLDDAALMRSFDYGVVATQLWGTTTNPPGTGGDFGMGFFNLPAAAQAVYKNAANFTLQNSARETPTAISWVVFFRGKPTPTGARASGAARSAVDSR